MDEIQGQPYFRKPPCIYIYTQTYIYIYRHIQIYVYLNYLKNQGELTYFVGWSPAFRALRSPNGREAGHAIVGTLLPYHDPVTQRWWRMFCGKLWYDVIIWLVVWNIWLIFPYIGLLIMPTDFHIFQRGFSLAHQPVIYGNLLNHP